MPLPIISTSLECNNYPKSMNIKLYPQDGNTAAVPSAPLDCSNLFRSGLAYYAASPCAAVETSASSSFKPIWLLPSAICCHPKKGGKGETQKSASSWIYWWFHWLAQLQIVKETSGTMWQYIECWNMLELLEWFWIRFGWTCKALLSQDRSLSPENRAAKSLEGWWFSMRLIDSLTIVGQQFHIFPGCY